MTDTANTKLRTWATLTGALVTALTMSMLAMFLMAPDRAEADTIINWSGSPGPSRLSEDPGAGCRRDSSATMGRIVVQAPQVWARSNYTGGQKVAYRVRLLRTDYHIGNGTWQIAATSPGYTRWAYPNTRASFPNTIFDVNPTGYNMEYVAQVHIYWYNQYGQVSGTVSREVDVYYQANLGQIQYQSCRM